MSKKEFWIRLAIFLAVAFAVPMVYLIIRYNLFSVNVSSNRVIGFWGVVVIGILACSLMVLVKFYLEGMKCKWSWTKQILEGFIKLIVPLVVLLVVFVWLGDNVVQIKEALYVTIPCEAVAVCVNPLPKWAFDNNVEGIGDIAESVFKRVKKSNTEADTSKENNVETTEASK